VTRVVDRRPVATLKQTCIPAATASGEVVRYPVVLPPEANSVPVWRVQLIGLSKGTERLQFMNQV